MPDVTLPEKRKVGSSTLPLTTILHRAELHKCQPDVLWPMAVSNRRCPLVTPGRCT